MAWRESSVVEERLGFVVLASQRERNLTELCGEFQISRQTGYVWLKRFRPAGRGRSWIAAGVRCIRPGGRVRRSKRRSFSCGSSWPDWGAPKLLVLRQQQPEWADISVRTVHRILERHGLIVEAARRKTLPARRSQ